MRWVSNVATKSRITIIRQVSAATRAWLRRPLPPHASGFWFLAPLSRRASSLSDQAQRPSQASPTDMPAQLPQSPSLWMSIAPYDMGLGIAAVVVSTGLGALLFSDVPERLSQGYVAAASETHEVEWSSEWRLEAEPSRHRLRPQLSTHVATPTTHTGSTVDRQTRTMATSAEPRTDDRARAN